MNDDVLAAIDKGEPLPATGTAHGHVRLKDGRLARIAYAYEDDPTAAARLHLQAEAFRHLAPAGRTPRLDEVIEPRPGLPGGALIVDFIEGRAPQLPGELDAMADTLARLHVLPLPAPGSPIPYQDNPFRTTLNVVEEGARRFLDKGVADPGARAEIVEELELMRVMAKTFAERPQPLSIALADTHPGNFIVDRGGLAWFVDLEKVHVGSAAVDLAHATLPTSTLWHPDVGKVLSLAEVAHFYETYLAQIGETRAAELRPWLQPMRRLTWLRTTMFMARWKVQTEAPRDPSDPSQWSDAGLEPAMKVHLRARIAQCFERDSIRALRAEWL
ncbi:phosphotransferase [uncultured Reyranella sp.]|uniref:phosphotransferase n=1 Tax=uncultured Reyranella sp. TaxID=735512 RepID=UPI00259CC8A4|nr:phosphotransferase [uncultured Reyranella sp.]